MQEFMTHVIVSSSLVHLNSSLVHSKVIINSCINTWLFMYHYCKVFSLYGYLLSSPCLFFFIFIFLPKVTQ